MKRRIVMVVVAASLLAISMAGAEDIAGLPLHLKKSEMGRSVSGSETTSRRRRSWPSPPQKDIVVVDTFGVPKVDAQIRKVIARELGRDDFAYLINTHEHADHTGGNSIYADCTIVGHDLIAAGLVRDRRRGATSVLEWYPQHARRHWRRSFKGLDSDDPGLRTSKRTSFTTACSSRRTRPAGSWCHRRLTFSDRMTLDLGNTTFELSYIGGMHTASDTAIFIPEYGLLLTGDLMADVWLTDAPGCLGHLHGARRACPTIFHACSPTGTGYWPTGSASRP